MTGIQRRVCEPSYIYITVHRWSSRWRRRSAHSGYRTGGGGQLGGTSGGGERGEPAAAQIDFYHDTYYCQLTAGDRGAVSGCGVRRGWAAQCLMCGEGRLGAGWGAELGQPRYCHRGCAVSRVTCHVSQVIVKQKLVDNCLQWQ